MVKNPHRDEADEESQDAPGEETQESVEREEKGGAEEHHGCGCGSGSWSWNWNWNWSWKLLKDVKKTL